MENPKNKKQPDPSTQQQSMNETRLTQEIPPDLPRYPKNVPKSIIDVLGADRTIDIVGLLEAERRTVAAVEAADLGYYVEECN
jgi:hypothetical protein